jgi:hypothetical protein
MALATTRSGLPLAVSARRRGCPDPRSTETERHACNYDGPTGNSGPLPSAFDACVRTQANSGTTAPCHRATRQRDSVQSDLDARKSATDGVANGTQTLGRASRSRCSPTRSPTPTTQPRPYGSVGRGPVPDQRKPAGYRREGPLSNSARIGDGLNPLTMR